MELPIVSIVIPTLNEEKLLGKTLKAIKNQNYEGKIEIIIVDGKSSDGTLKLAKKYVNKLIVRKSNIAEAKNIGAKYAKGNYLIFLDADTILSKNWVKRAVNNFGMKNTDMTVGIFSSQEKNWKALFTAKFWGEILPTLLKKIGNEIYVGPATFAIKKNMFNSVGGFDEKFLAGEDVVFVVRNRRRLKIVFDNKLKTFTSMRRFEKGGYLKWGLIWLVAGLPLTFGKRVPFDSWYFNRATS